MKKFYAILAAALFGAAASQAAITVTLEDGTPVENGGTVTIDKSMFERTYIPNILDKWIGKVDIEVESPAPTNVELTSSSADIQFCPVGQNCYTLNDFDGSGVFTGSGTLTAAKSQIPVDLNLYDLGDTLPAIKETLKAVFTTSSNETFTVTFLFDTSIESGVEGIVAEAADAAVYSISGVKVLDSAAALHTLPAGLYITGGKKVLVK